MRGGPLLLEDHLSLKSETCTTRDVIDMIKTAVLMRFFFCIAAFFLLTAAARSPQTIKTKEYDIRIIEIASGLEHPWSLAFLPDGRIW